MRLAVSELIFAVKSKEAADHLPLEQLERGLRMLHAYVGHSNLYLRRMRARLSSV